MRQKGTKNLDINTRRRLQDLLSLSIDKESIARELSVCTRTIYREIERGTINGQYNAEYAQQAYIDKLKNKGRKPELSLDTDLAQRISDLILLEKMSPEKIHQQLSVERKYCPSKQTIYLAIDNGLVPNVTRDSLKNDVTTVFSRGLVQLSKWAREQIQLVDGDKVRIKIKGNCLVLEKVSVEKNNGSL